MPRIVLKREGAFARIEAPWFGDDERFAAYRRATEGVRFDRAKRVRLAALDKVPTILRRLREGGFDVRVDNELREVLQMRTAADWLDLKAAQERIAQIDEQIFTSSGNRLFPFQRTGAQWLSLRYGALLADDMGLGKTLQTIAALPAGVPILVVGPAAAKGVWLGEMERWRPHVPVRMLSGRGSFRWPREGEMLVTNYDILPPKCVPPCDGKLPAKPCTGCKKELVFDAVGCRMGIVGHEATCTGLMPEDIEPREDCPGCNPIFKAAPPGCVVVLDEAQYVKSLRAQRTQRARALSAAARAEHGRCWLLSGTPFENDPGELWALLTVAGCAEEAFGDFKTFTSPSCFNGKAKSFGREKKHAGFTWGAPGSEVVERLQRVQLRRLKSEVLPELPTKLRREVIVEIDAKAVRACDAFLERSGGIERIVELLDAEKKAAFESMAEVRKALAAAKVPALLELVEELEEQGEPVVVFSCHRAPIDLLAKRRGWDTITGDVTGSARDATGVEKPKRKIIEERFQRGELRGLACTIQAAGVALTLTRANQAIFIDLDWKPSANAQAEDRILRIGQTRGCIITILKANHPLDRRVVEVLMRKTRLFEASIDAASVADDAPPCRDVDFEEKLRQVQEEIACGRAVRRMAESTEEQNALEALHALSFTGSDERLARQLVEEAGAIGLSDAQWALASRVSTRGTRPVRAAVAPVEELEDKPVREDVVRTAGEDE